MTMDEFLRSKGMNPNALSHITKYTTLVNAIGLSKLIPIIPATLPDLCKAIVTDEHLNTIPLPEWDRATSFLGVHLRIIGITSSSLAERVCILKRAATMYVQYGRGVA